MPSPAPNPVLSPTSYVVLGSLAVLGPSTPYELKQAVTAGIGYFWTFPHSQLYSEPQRLAAAGLAAEERETEGRRRRVFTITRSGRAALQAWVGEPTSELPEIRDVALLKLFFGETVDSAAVVALASAQAAAHRGRRAVYQALDAIAPDTPAGRTVGLGLAFERAAAAFWQSIADDPPG